MRCSPGALHQLIGAARDHQVDQMVRRGSSRTSCRLFHQLQAVLKAGSADSTASAQKGEEDAVGAQRLGAPLR